MTMCFKSAVAVFLLVGAVQSTSFGQTRKDTSGKAGRADTSNNAVQQRVSPNTADDKAVKKLDTTDSKMPVAKPSSGDQMPNPYKRKGSSQGEAGKKSGRP